MGETYYLTHIPISITRDDEFTLEISKRLFANAVARYIKEETNCKVDISLIEEVVNAMEDCDILDVQNDENLLDRIHDYLMDYVYAEHKHIENGDEICVM